MTWLAIFLAVITLLVVLGSLWLRRIFRKSPEKIDRCERWVMSAIDETMEKDAK